MSFYNRLYGTKLSTITGEQVQWRTTQWLTSQWSAPISPTSHHRSEIQVRNRSGGGLYSNHWRADLIPDRGVKVTEQNGDLTQFSRQGEVTTTSVKPHNKEIMADIH